MLSLGRLLADAPKPNRPAWNSSGATRRQGPSLPRASTTTGSPSESGGNPAMNLPRPVLESMLGSLSNFTLLHGRSEQRPCRAGQAHALRIAASLPPQALPVC